MTTLYSVRNKTWTLNFFSSLPCAELILDWVVDMHCDLHPSCKM